MTSSIKCLFLLIVSFQVLSPVVSLAAPEKQQGKKQEKQKYNILFIISTEGAKVENYCQLRMNFMTSKKTPSNTQTLLKIRSTQTSLKSIRKK